VILSFDFGGTKIVAALIDISQGTILDSIKTKPPATNTDNEILFQMIDCGNVLLSQNPKLKVDSIGISFGGLVNKDGRTVMKSQHISGWDNYPLAEIVEREFNLPVIVENDANAAALGEWSFGVGKGISPFFYMQISTGIGSGIIIEGEIFHGHGLAGEVGHISIDKNGPLCKCGNKGCLESFSAGWALDQKAQQLLGTKAGAKELFDETLKENKDAIEIVQSALLPLAYVINAIQCLLDPEVICMGGGVTRSRLVISKYLFPMIEQITPPFMEKRTQIKFSELNGSETLLGAAVLAERQRSPEGKIYI
jgi:glucokinase